ncbi:MAG: hypothetical protein AAGE52_01265 [Myxococcota bacterium]
MSTSIWESLIAIEDAEHDELEATDTVAHRVLLNNVSHLADSCGQPLIAWTSSNPVSRAIAESAVWHRLWNSPTFAVRTRPDGESYRIRTRLRGEFLTGSGNASFAVTLASALDPGAHVREISAYAEAVNDTPPRSYVSPALEVYSSTVGAGDAWIAPVQNGGLLSLASPTASIESTDDVLSGDIISVPVYSATLVVWALAETTKPDADLTGLYAAEYFGT